MEESRKIQAQEVKKKLDEQEQLINTESKIINNTIEFTHKTENCRVRIPTHRERLETEKVRNKKYFELLQDDSYKLKEELIQIYKRKNINISAMESEIGDINATINKVDENLAQTINQSAREKYIAQKDKLKLQRAELSIKITDLLQYSIEDTLRDFMNDYLVFLVLEKEDTEKKEWMRVFKTYDEYLNSEDELLRLRATGELSILIYNYGNM